MRHFEHVASKALWVSKSSTTMWKLLGRHFRCLILLQANQVWLLMFVVVHPTALLTPKQQCLHWQKLQRCQRQRPFRSSRSSLLLKKSYCRSSRGVNWQSKQVRRGRKQSYALNCTTNVSRMLSRKELTFSENESQARTQQLPHFPSTRLLQTWIKSTILSREQEAQQDHALQGCTSWKSGRKSHEARSCSQDTRYPTWCHLFARRG